MIIVLTGIDGAGKSTAGRLLTQRLDAAGCPAVFMMNRSGRRSIAGWCARHDLHPPALLLDAVETILRSVNVLVSQARARMGARVVVMDRYLHCQMALRRVRGLSRGRVLPLLLSIFPAPDVVFHFDIAAEVALARITGRGLDAESLEYLEAFAKAYRELDDYTSFVVLDASASSERVVEDMLQALGACGSGVR